MVGTIGRQEITGTTGTSATIAQADLPEKGPLMHGPRAIDLPETDLPETDLLVTGRQATDLETVPPPTDPEIAHPATDLRVIDPQVVAGPRATIGIETKKGRRSNATEGDR
jgi:hypothetical protein